MAKNRILALTATGTGLNTGNTGLATGLLAKSNRKFHPVLTNFGRNPVYSSENRAADAALALKSTGTGISTGSATGTFDHPDIWASQGRGVPVARRTR